VSSQNIVFNWEMLRTTIRRKNSHSPVPLQAAGDSDMGEVSKIATFEGRVVQFKCRLIPCANQGGSGHSRSDNIAQLLSLTVSNSYHYLGGRPDNVSNQPVKTASFVVCWVTVIPGPAARGVAG
jgi:hypothetical protein